MAISIKDIFKEGLLERLGNSYEMLKERENSYSKISKSRKVKTQILNAKEKLKDCDEELKELLLNFIKKKETQKMQPSKKVSPITVNVYTHYDYSNGNLEIIFPVKDEKGLLQKLIYNQLSPKNARKIVMNGYLSKKYGISSPIELDAIPRSIELLSNSPELKDAKVSVKVNDLDFNYLDGEKELVETFYTIKSLAKKAGEDYASILTKVRDGEIKASKRGRSWIIEQDEGNKFLSKYQKYHKEAPAKKVPSQAFKKYEPYAKDIIAGMENIDIRKKYKIHYRVLAITHRLYNLGKFDYLKKQK